MTAQEIFQQIQQKRSFLCVGLDSDINKIPPHLLTSEDPIFEFNKQIIDATKDLCVAYKPNIAFYESRGVKDGKALRKPSITFLKKFLPLPMPKEVISAIPLICMPVLFSKT